MDTQLQIRQNAMDAQEALSGLFAWQKSIKSSEKKVGTKATASSSTPAPRGRAAVSVGPAPEDLQTPTAFAKPGMGNSGIQQPAADLSAMSGKRTAAAHTHSNYNKWDKLDVDAMLNSDSDEDSAASKRKPKAKQVQPSVASTSSASSFAPAQTGIKIVPNDAKQPADISAASTRRLNVSTPSSAETQQPSKSHPPVRNSEPQTADAWRTRGNELFKAGQYSFAKDCYTRSIDLDSTSALAYANRAMAELKMSLWTQAEADCTRAIELDTSYVKAYHRRGTARQQLGKHLEAAQDFEDAYRLEPASRSLLTDRDTALAAYMQAEKISATSKRSSIALDTAHIILPPTSSSTSLSKTKQPGDGQTSTFSKTSQSVESVSVTGTASAAVKEATQSGQDAGAAKAVDLLSVPSQSGNAPSSSDTSSRAASRSVSQSGAAALGSPRQEGADQKAKLTAAATAAAQQLATRMVSQVKCPKTSTEFEATWRSLSSSNASNTSSQLSYLGLMPPPQLPSIFKSSLTPQLLTAILTVLLNGVINKTACMSEEQQDGEHAGEQVYTAAKALSFVQGLVKVPRLEMAAMCIGSKQKSELKQLWDCAFGSASGVDDSIKAAAASAQKSLKL